MSAESASSGGTRHFSCTADISLKTEHEVRTVTNPHQHLPLSKLKLFDYLHLSLSDLLSYISNLLSTDVDCRLKCTQAMVAHDWAQNRRRAAP